MTYVKKSWSARDIVLTSDANRWEDHHEEVDAELRGRLAEASLSSTFVAQADAEQMVSDTLAADPTIQSAANTAVNNAAAGLDILTPDGLADRTVINANDRGVVADGVTNDAPAWNALVAAAPPGTVITWTGRSMLKDPIIWKSGVSLIGQGWGRSVLATYDDGVNLTWHAAIRWVEGDGATTTNTLDDCTWANFEVDGSQLTTGGVYKISAKGLFTLFHRRCQWLNLYVHDTQATGIGCDAMQDCLISGVVAERCGYMNPGNAGGGAGIGIGTGAWEYEPLVITGCTTRDCGNWGIFVEWQEYWPFRGTGSIITGNTSIGDRVGLGDRGTIGTIITNNTVIGSTSSGIMVTFGSREGMVADNHVYDAGSTSIVVQTGCSDVQVRGNHCKGGALHGIQVDALSSNVKNVTVEANHVTGHNNCGILFGSLTGGRADGAVVRGNRCWNNGQAGGSYTQGVRFEANATGVTIAGNRAFDDQTVKTQGAGLQLSGSAAYTLTDAVIERNHFTGGAAALSLGAVTRTNVRVRDNLGYYTEKDGSATIPDGASTVVVTHGLAGVPSVVTLGKRTSEDVWVSVRGATTFTIARTGTTGALVVDWAASYRP